MQPASRPLEFVPTKVRVIDPPPAGLDRGRGWLAVRAYPPGLDPVFMGTAWFHYDGAPSPRSPFLHLRPSDQASPVAFHIPLFRSDMLGGTTLLDQTPGWRRIDFLFQLPQPLAVPSVDLHLLTGPDPAPPAGAAPTGQVVLTDLWRYQNAAHSPFPTAAPPGLQPGFVGGAPKSGTTWMELLLNQHPLICSVGEGSLMGNVTMRDWVPANRWVPPRVPRAMLNHFGNQAVLLRTLQVFRDHTACGVVLDKSPGNARRYRRLLAYAPAARLIHCVRHPLDVLISHLHHEANLVRGGGSPSVDLAEHRGAIDRLSDLLGAAGVLALDESFWPLVAKIYDLYAEFQTEALALLDQKSTKLLVMRYEDMLDHPNESAARVFAHLGVEASADLVTRCVENVSFGNLREKRGNTEHTFFRAGTARQYEALIAPDYRARIMDYLRSVMPRFDELGYA